MPRMSHQLRQLGRQSRLPASPAVAALKRVRNPHPDAAYVARFTAPEFTTLCPITAQPDFAHLVIDYVPAKWLVESKSLKLYLGSFPQHRRAFMRTARSPLARDLLHCSHRSSCASAAIGIRGEECP